MKKLDDKAQKIKNDIDSIYMTNIYGNKLNANELYIKAKNELQEINRNKNRSLSPEPYQKTEGGRNILRQMNNSEL